MAIRVVNGSTSTEDGWPLVDQDGCTWVTIPGTSPTVTIQAQTGIPATLFRAWTADLNAFVEKVRDADTASWTEGNSVLGGYGQNDGSNHLGGTAEDVNWKDHPMGPSYAGWSDTEIAEIRRMREFYKLPDGTYLIWWAEDWDTPKDSMHFQMGYDTFGRQDDIHDWIARNVRADGFSTYRRGNTAVPSSTAAEILASATGVTFDKAQSMLSTVQQGLNAAQCTNARRIAMFLAQTGEESAGFSTTTEFASGAEYEGRADLGNTQPGDGVKFKGRTWIQITGRAHYTEFSKWAFGQGLCSSPTQFVDDPASLADMQWAGIGAAWYWVVERPQINSLCDNGDVLGVTKAVNGGTNGLADRQARYTRAIALGDQLLTLLSDGDDFMSALSDDEQRELLNLARQIADVRRPSLSPLRHLGEGNVNTCAGFAWTADSLTHPQFVFTAAKLGHADSIKLLAEVAGADPVKYPDRAEDAALATSMLAEIEATNPAALQAFLKGQSA